MSPTIPRWNRHIGWLLLVGAFVWAIWLDPWSLGEVDPRALPGSARMAARQAQAVVIGMAFLQLILAPILARAIFSPQLRRFVAIITGCGALVYSAGYGLAAEYPSGTWLIPMGALLNAVGFGSLALTGWKARGADRNLTGLCIILSAITFGMLLDALMGLFAANSAFLPTLLGREDGVRLRMLRLARAAAIALSVLALLYHDLLNEDNASHAHAARGRVLMVGGALGMPLILSLAAFGNLAFKYLLPLPAFAVFYGTIVGGILTWKRPARGWEFWGWAMIAASMGAGLLMGMYAFDGPLASPLGAYNEFARRLSRLGHAYCIVMGLLVIFLAREIQDSKIQDRKAPNALTVGGTQWLQTCGSALLVTGILCTILVILLVAANWLPTKLLGVGPAIVALSTLLFLSSDRRLHARPDQRTEGAK